MHQGRRVHKHARSTTELIQAPCPKSSLRSSQGWFTNFKLRESLSPHSGLLLLCLPQPDWDSSDASALYRLRRIETVLQQAPPSSRGEGLFCPLSPRFFDFLSGTYGETSEASSLERLQSCKNSFKQDPLIRNSLLGFSISCNKPSQKPVKVEVKKASQIRNWLPLTLPYRPQNQPLL